MNFVLLMLTLVCYTPPDGIEVCHPNTIVPVYFQDSDLCEAAKRHMLQLQPTELTLTCERVTRPTMGEESRGKK
jgi:hypothetical protein